MKNFFWVVAALALVTATSAEATIFSTDKNCNPQQDWCVDIRSDDSVAAHSTMVTGKTYAVTGKGAKSAEYQTAIENDQAPAYDGFWLSPQDIQNNQIGRMAFILNSVTELDSNKTFALKNCYIQAIFKDYKIKLPGIVHMTISKRQTNEYQCSIS